ncbi:hypothetical protein DFH08DRAFT_1081472 [Mycena albidolilacea]|uniref:Uncharacterized protein n=1 Tax=Mycena albidolilacea TaxID=1033008 RepID=A0AAD6ZY30_9AGAR|nr:hypothetical protein DFH08DRAFT_1081472 [Mycena albidolilacea]
MSSRFQVPDHISSFLETGVLSPSARVSSRVRSSNGRPEVGSFLPFQHGLTGTPGPLRQRATISAPSSPPVSITELLRAAGGLYTPPMGASRHLEAEFSRRGHKERTRDSYVHVSLRLWSPKKTKQFKLLVEFLLALPNLTSLRIRWQLQFKVGLQGRGNSKLFSAFTDVSLPSVTSLSVSDNLHPIFHAFPNVTTLACPSILAGSDALRPAIECFPYLDALVGLLSLDIHQTTYSSPAEFARHFPRLRMLCITNPIPCNNELQPSLALLRAFTHLSELTFFARSDKNIFPLEVLLACGMDILRESTSLDAKSDARAFRDRPTDIAYLRDLPNPRKSVRKFNFGVSARAISCNFSRATFIIPTHNFPTLASIPLLRSRWGPYSDKLM